MAKPAGSSGNSKPVAPPKISNPKPVAPGMGPGGARTVKGPKINDKTKPATRGMGGVASGSPHAPGMGKYKP